MQNVDAPASEAEQGLCVTLALLSFALVVDPRRRMLQAR